MSAKASMEYLIVHSGVQKPKISLRRVAFSNADEWPIFVSPSTADVFAPFSLTLVLCSTREAVSNLLFLSVCPFLPPKFHTKCSLYSTDRQKGERKPRVGAIAVGGSHSQGRKRAADGAVFGVWEGPR
ncbi:hypothetical protein Ddc_02397 [Ditylenchus destructor]|nr:hypothetical protein Ddc_02397 [Ditylenchus destructor]